MEKVFADGFFFKRQENAPSFVVGRINIKVAEAIEWMKKNADGEWISIDIKEGQEGKHYCQLNNWKPTKSEDRTPPDQKPKEEMRDKDAFAKARAGAQDDEIPF
jgi:hypothetical protein